MKKRFLLRALGLVLLTAMAVTAVIPVRRPESDNSAWMAALGDETPINSIAIPGTHDSGALYSFAQVYGKCQSLPVREQLEIGVRFLDIRLRLVEDELRVIHSIADQKTYFEDMLRDIAGFIERNPSEFLVLLLVEERGAKDSSMAFAEAVESMLLQYPEILSVSDTLPETVGEARGKLHIISRYEGAGIGISLSGSWQSNKSFEAGGIYVQDRYKISDTMQKKQEVSNAFEVAKLQEHDLVLNYLSCWISPGFPPVYAGVTAAELNPWFETYYPGLQQPCGVVVLDFVTSELAEMVIGSNFQ